MKTLKLIANFTNNIANGYKEQVNRKINCENKEDVYDLMQEARTLENSGDTKSVTVQYLISGEYVGNLKFWETEYICPGDVSDNILDDFDFQN